MRYLKVILIAFLIGVTTVSVFRYISIIKEKRILLENLEKDQMQIITLSDDKLKLSSALEKEKDLNQEIIQKNILLRDNLRASNKRLGKLFVEFDQNNKESNSRILMLKAESMFLRKEEEKLRFDLVQISQQRDNLNARLTSIPELKKAISELKKQKRLVPSAGLKEKLIVELMSEGNRGYLIKDGKSFSAATVKIEVNPAFKNAQ